MCAAIVAALVTTSAPALAQPHAILEPEPGVFDLMSAVDEALARNPALSAARERYQAEMISARSAGALPPPLLETRVWQWPVTSFYPRRETSIILEASQVIPSAEKREAARKLADQNSAASSAALAASARALVNRVKHAYTALYVARKQREFTSALLPLVTTAVEAAQLAYASGTSSPGDARRAILEITKLHEEILVSEERARLAEVELNELMNRPPTSRFGTLREPGEWTLLTSPERLQQLALERQPELWAARAKVARATANVELARQSARGDVVVRGGYMFMPGSAGAWTGGVGISWPKAPWARTTVNLKVAEAQAELSAAQLEQQTVENRIRTAVYRAWVRVKAAEQHAALARATALPQVRQAVEVAQVGYRSDRGRFVEVIETQRALLAAELDYLLALSAFHSGLVDLEDAVGQELPGEMFQAVPAAPARARETAAPTQGERQ